MLAPGRHLGAPKTGVGTDLGGIIFFFFFFFGGDLVFECLSCGLLWLFWVLGDQAFRPFVISLFSVSWKLICLSLPFVS